MNVGDLPRLVCPACRGKLSWEGRTSAGRVVEGTLACAGCGARWPVEDGLPRLYREEDVRGTDRLLRVFYDGLPWLHDPLTAVVAPLLQSTTEAAARDRYMRRVDLASLVEGESGRPVRILEIGIGAGANLPLLWRDLPRGVDAEIWGVDLSLGMLAECRKRLARAPGQNVRLAMADAHALPFPDGTFDRVIEVGGTGGFRDPRRALAEMVRVVRPSAPIVVVDEQLDPASRRSLVHRAAFRLLTFYAKDPRCPRELLPEGVTGVTEEQVSRYYYCLSFRAPPARSAPGPAAGASSLP